MLNRHSKQTVIKAQVTSVNDATQRVTLAVLTETQASVHPCCGGYCGSQLNPLSATAQSIFSLPASTLEKMQADNHFQLQQGSVVDLTINTINLLSYQFWHWLIGCIFFISMLWLLPQNLLGFGGAIGLTMSYLFLINNLLKKFNCHPHQLMSLTPSKP